MTITANTAVTPQRVAFIGLGNMGGPMAANLVKAGHRVAGFDLVEGARDAAAAHGIRIAASAADTVADADTVITMLPSGRHVLDCYAGTGTARGLLQAARPGTVFIDCSTIGADEARIAHEAAVSGGHRAIDAPVSGGVTGATGATLTFMVGAASDDYAAARAVLEGMGARVVHCGGPGAGQAAKICNNMILGISMIAVSEAFVLGRALGLTDQALFDVASTASGQCWALTSNCPVPGPVPSSPANRGYQPGFSAALMAKDLELASTAAETHGIAATLGHSATLAYASYTAQGGAGKDFSAIITDIHSRSGFPGEPRPERNRRDDLD
jgi:3-hydroxyisobutyrate dehydrogenase